MATGGEITLTIGELAKAAGVRTSTVRFYERRGLLRPETRSASNYRGYTTLTVERLRFIRSAQASGFGLKDIAEMLALTNDDGSPCATVAALIDRRLVEVKARLRELRHVERTLVRAKGSCCMKDDADLCTEIQRFKTRGEIRA